MGWPARIPLLLCLAPVLAAALYAARPRHRRFPVVKALSLASLAAGTGATVFGFLSLLRTIGQRPSLSQADWPWIATGMSERLVTISASLGFLTLAWLLVAIGAARARDGSIHDG